MAAPHLKTSSLEQSSSPFEIRNIDAYQAWRARKLQMQPKNVQALIVEIADPLQLTTAEHSAVMQRVRTANMAIFSVDQPMDKARLIRLCAQFGLERLDKNLCADDEGISELQVVPNGRAHEYIPYTDKPINWHTDGYYNAPYALIRAMVLHCIHPAAYGGANALLDPEMIYLLLRDAEPDYIAALMHPQCMTIPANVENGIEIRPAQSGAVFSVDQTGNLHMRYTARTRSIEWRDDALTRAAVGHIERLLKLDLPFIFTHRLEAGQGIISNNVLHTRTAFEDDTVSGIHRLMYRARYYDRITSSE